MRLPKALERWGTEAVRLARPAQKDFMEVYRLALADLDEKGIALTDYACSRVLADVHRHMDTPGSWVLLLGAENEPARGMLSGYQVARSRCRPGFDIRLEGLYVEPSSRGLTGAASLIRAGIAQAKRDGARRVFAEGDEFNAGYAALGECRTRYAYEMEL